MAQNTDDWAQVRRLGQILGHIARASAVYPNLLLGVFGAGRCHGIKLAAIPDMYQDSSNSEMGCAAILMAQHADVWAQVTRLGLIRSHSKGAKCHLYVEVGCVCGG